MPIRRRRRSITREDQERAPRLSPGGTTPVAGPPLRVIAGNLVRVTAKGVWHWIRPGSALFYAGLLAAAYLGYVQLRPQFGHRTIEVCTVTDFSFRLDRPDWENDVRGWFLEVNRAFAPAGVEWHPTSGGDAYPERSGLANLKARREWIEQSGNCAGKVVVAFTDAAGAHSDASVAPFGRIVALAIRSRSGNAQVVSALTFSLARLFGGQVATNTLIYTDGPQDGSLPASTIGLIRSLRNYDFSNGVAGLTDRWKSRAIEAIAKSVASQSTNPAFDAHRTIARAFADANRHEEAALHLRQAIQANPTDLRTRLELALELNANAQTEEALAALKEATAVDSQDARPFAVMSAILLNLKRKPEAIQQMREAVRRDSGNAAYQALLGNMLMTEVGGATEAQAAFSAAARGQSMNPDAILGMAQLMSAPMVASDALRAAREEVRRAPDSVEAHRQLAMALAQAADTTGARKEFERILQLQPKDGLARLALAQIDFMTGNLDAAKAQLEAAAAVGAQPSASFVRALRDQFAAQ